MYTHSPQANADTWQIKGLINSLCWTISPHHRRMKNKQIPVGLARPGHLVGLSVDDWVAQGCSVWGLGWSHNCFLWAAQPPEPLHNWLSGWYSPPPSFSSHPPNSYTLLSRSNPPLPFKTPYSKRSSSSLFSSPPVSQPIHSHSFSPRLNTSLVALSGWSRLNKFLNFCVLHLKKKKNFLASVFTWPCLPVFVHVSAL